MELRADHRRCRYEMLFNNMKVNTGRNRSRNNGVKIRIRGKTGKGVGKKTYFLGLSAWFPFLFPANYILIIKKQNKKNTKGF